jgi:hypothetical protein
MEGMVANHTWDYKRTNLRQFGDNLCGWKILFECTSCTSVIVWRLNIWPVHWQTSWGTCYCFPKRFTCASMIAIMSFWNEPIVITIKELELIREGVELAIVSYTLSLPTKSMEIHVVVVNIRVEGLE